MDEQNIIKAQAKEHDAFKRACISVAQRVHRTDVNLRMKLMGESGAKVRPLNDKKAIENGANFLSETFVFAVAGGIILFESYRQRQKELIRRESVADDIKTLQYEIQYLKRKLQEYNVRLDDYVPPADVQPLVLKLDQNGNELDIDQAMDKINARIKQIEKIHNQEPAVMGKNNVTNEINVLEPKRLKDPKQQEPTSSSSEPIKK